MPKPLGHQMDRRPLSEWEYIALSDAMAQPWRLVYGIMWETGGRLADVLTLRREALDDPYLRVSDSLLNDLNTFLLGLHRQRIFARGNRETPYTEQAAHAALKAAAVKAGVRRSVHPDLYRRGRPG